MEAPSRNTATGQLYPEHVRGFGYMPLACMPGLGGFTTEVALVQLFDGSYAILYLGRKGNIIHDHPVQTDSEYVARDVFRWRTAC